MRKLLFLLFVLAVTLQSGAQTFMVGDICYTVTSENEPYTVEVARNTKPTNNYIGEVTIPEKVDKDGKSYIVTGIGESAFSNCYMISSVIIPNTVKSIGNYAFTGCSGLRKLAIPNSVTSIGVAAFFNCNNLKNIVIPASVKTIGNGAFNNEVCFFFCEAASKPMGWDLSSNSHWNNRKGVVFWNSFVDGEFGYQRITANTVSFAKTLGYKESVTIPSKVSYSGVSYTVTGISDNTFADNIDISEVVMPNTITSIGKSAFYGCTEIAAITIPESVTTIGDNAFSGCTSLTSIVIPSLVTTIGNGVFSDCASLTSVTIPNTVTTIGKNAFSNCISLTSVTLPNAVTTIGNNAFSGCSELSSITIPNSVTTIGSYAFSDCKEMVSISIPRSVTNIGGNAFSGLKSVSYQGGASGKPWGAKTCGVWQDGDFVYANAEKTQLAAYVGNSQSVTIDNSITSIGTNAFYGCASLTSITIPNSVTAIGDNAFSDCTSLTSVSIPNSVKNIGNSAFSNCKNLSIITMSNSVTSIGKSVFTGCIGLTSVTLSNSLVSIGKGAFSGCTALTSIVIPNMVTAIDDNLFSGCTSLAAVTISNSAKSIGKNAFAGCAELKSITIPNSVKNIDSYAFSECDKLTTVLIPKSVTVIWGNAFNNNNIEFYCECLGRPTGWSGDESKKSWNSGKGTIHWEVSFIADSIAYFVTSLSTVSAKRYIGSGPMLKIPSTVKNNGQEYSVSGIAKYAFYGYKNITAVAIPKTVTTIGEKAFSGCDNIKAIYCEVEGMPVGWAADCFPASNVVTWGKDAFSDFMK
ncbi:MAG: leucine-rich repeat domain-containing protein [Salinivirgaceae bacterium]|nr:leucine-rich repeat domain-containing protein [Salinivirgaceae bacterium]